MPVFRAIAALVKRGLLVDPAIKDNLAMTNIPKLVPRNLTRDEFTDEVKQQRQQATQEYEALKKRYAPEGVNRLEVGMAGESRALFQQVVGKNVRLEDALKVFKQTWGDDMFNAVTKGVPMPYLEPPKNKQEKKPTLYSIERDEQKAATAATMALYQGMTMSQVARVQKEIRRQR